MKIAEKVEYGTIGRCCRLEDGTVLGVSRTKLKEVIEGHDEMGEEEELGISGEGGEQMKVLLSVNEIEEPVEDQFCTAASNDTTRECIRWSLKKGIEDAISAIRRATGLPLEFDVFVVHGVPGVLCRWGVVVYGEGEPEVLTIGEFLQLAELKSEGIE